MVYYGASFLHTLPGKLGCSYEKKMSGRLGHMRTMARVHLKYRMEMVQTERTKSKAIQQLVSGLFYHYSYFWCFGNRGDDGIESEEAASGGSATKLDAPCRLPGKIGESERKMVK